MMFGERGGEVLGMITCEKLCKSACRRLCRTTTFGAVLPVSSNTGKGTLPHRQLTDAVHHCENFATTLEAAVRVLLSVPLVVWIEVVNSLSIFFQDLRVPWQTNAFYVLSAARLT